MRASGNYAAPHSKVDALAATRPNFAGYGLGFNLRDYQGRKLALHGGARAAGSAPSLPLAA